MGGSAKGSWMKSLYIHSTNDKYKFPLEIGGTVRELSELTGKSEAGIYSMISRKETPAWEKIEVEIMARSIDKRLDRYGSKYAIKEKKETELIIKDPERQVDHFLNVERTRAVIEFIELLKRELI